jgi:hypothetical protein
MKTRQLQRIQLRRRDERRSALRWAGPELQRELLRRDRGEAFWDASKAVAAWFSNSLRSKRSSTNKCAVALTRVSPGRSSKITPFLLNMYLSARQRFRKNSD